MIRLDDEKSSDAVMSRKSVYIGANMFQNIGEKLELSVTEPSNSNILEERRVGWKLENLRKRTEDQVNEQGEESRPTATIICFGTDPIAKAKADFTYSFLGMAGIKVADQIILKEEKALHSIVKELDSSLIVYCFKDTPDQLSAEFEHATAKVCIAGQYEEEATWKERGLYACIHRKVEAYSFLHQLLSDLKISQS